MPMLPRNLAQKVFTSLKVNEAKGISRIKQNCKTMSNTLNKETILTILSTVRSGERGEDVVSSGMISSIVLRGESVGFALEFSPEQVEPEQAEALRKACEDVVREKTKAKKVTAVLTAVKSGGHSQRQQKEQIKTIRRAEKERHPPQAIPGVKKIIAVASGKGGVGKSTISVNLACALARAGYNTAIVDADIYGPSVPKMLGLSGQPEINKENKMVPLKAHGLQSVSMGYLMPEDRAAVWRGPMAIKALFQLFRGTAWNDVEYLIVDMPPGTGDIQLSLADNIPVDGVILVSTPQEIALLDVRKAADMFTKVGIPILGVVENMSYFEDPASGNRSYIFGKNGAKHFAESLGVECLAEVPLNVELREASDKGEPKESEIFDILAGEVEKYAMKH